MNRYSGISNSAPPTKISPQNYMVLATTVWWPHSTFVTTPISSNGVDALSMKVTQSRKQASATLKTARLPREQCCDDGHCPVLELGRKLNPAHLLQWPEMHMLQDTGVRASTNTWPPHKGHHQLMPPTLAKKPSAAIVNNRITLLVTVIWLT